MVAHQNRVDPWGKIVSVAARGTLMGNRGLLHDDSGSIVRNTALTRWISCELSFKDRRRPVLQPGRYTELFFLDEATALAAGHRPCFECRRSDAEAFRAALGGIFGLGERPSAPDMDAVLDRVRGAYTSHLGATGFPDGSIVARGPTAWLLCGDNAYEWSHVGYLGAQPRELLGQVDALTCRPIRMALANGYQPRLHPSVGC